MNSDYIKKAKSKAKSLGVEIEPSKRKGKKFHIKDTNIHFGAKGMSDFLIHGDELRRKRFHDRFKNNKGYKDPKSPLFYSQKILW